MYLMETPITETEMELKENIQELLLDGIFHYNGLEVIKETSLDFEESNQLNSFELIEDDIEAWIEDNSNSRQCSNDDSDFDASYKKRAVEYWRYLDTNDKSNRQRHRSLKTVQHKFRRVSSERQLTRWKEQLLAGGTRTEKLSFISKFTHDKFTAAIDSGLTVHDIDIKRWALQAQNIIGELNPLFKASDSWITRFKKSHRIVSRKITKFITKKTVEDLDNLQQASDNFVNIVKSLIEKHGPEQIYNSDQSGFQLEIHSGRSLADEGVKRVERIVQSVSSTTHSYTVQPIISCDGRLLSPLFIVLQESSGTFGPIIQRQLFQPENVIVKASKSGKMTSGM